jgi:hypothetical protein
MLRSRIEVATGSLTFSLTSSYQKIMPFGILDTIFGEEVPPALFNLMDERQPLPSPRTCKQTGKTGLYDYVAVKRYMRHSAAGMEPAR